MLKKIIKKEGGFTLLELLIVIVIIGILALLIIPNVTSAPKKARDTTRKTDITAIRKALEEYYVSNQAYPVQVAAANADTALTALTAGSPAILKTVPKDPKSTQNYTYQSADGTAYTLNACLENTGDTGANVVTAVSPCTTKTFQMTNSN